MGQALVTSVGVGLIGLMATAVLGLMASDSSAISRHVSFGIFSTMILLFTHSMMMFYLIGKGKAVKDALSEEGHGPETPQYREYYGRISLARKPVFSSATFAMLLTMFAAIMGASVDTGVLPPIVHAMIAYGAIALNLAAIKTEIDALKASSIVVDEVNQFLAS